MTEPRQTNALAEYQEAAARLRGNEQLIRSSLTLFIAYSAASSGVIHAEGVGDGTRVALALVGSVMSLMLLTSHLRVRAYSASTRDRLIELEGTLGMNLYAKAKEDVGSTRTVSTQVAFTIIYLLGVVYFATASAIYFFS